MSDPRFIAVQSIRDGTDRTLQTFLRIDDISAIFLHENGFCSVELRNGSIYSIEEKHSVELLALIGRGAG